jgi:hypothetical protein
MKQLIHEEVEEQYINARSSGKILNLETGRSIQLPTALSMVNYRGYLYDSHLNIVGRKSLVESFKDMSTMFTGGAHCKVTGGAAVNCSEEKIEECKEQDKVCKENTGKCVSKSYAKRLRAKDMEYDEDLGVVGTEEDIKKVKKKMKKKAKKKVKKKVRAPPTPTPSPVPSPVPSPAPSPIPTPTPSPVKMPTKKKKIKVIEIPKEVDEKLVAAIKKCRRENKYYNIYTKRCNAEKTARSKNMIFDEKNMLTANTKDELDTFIEEQNLQPEKKKKKKEKEKVKKKKLKEKEEIEKALLEEQRREEEREEELEEERKREEKRQEEERKQEEKRLKEEKRARIRAEKAAAEERRAKAVKFPAAIKKIEEKYDLLEYDLKVRKEKSKKKRIFERKKIREAEDISEERKKELIKAINKSREKEKKILEKLREEYKKAKKEEIKKVKEKQKREEEEKREKVTPPVLPTPPTLPTLPTPPTPKPRKRCHDLDDPEICKDDEICVVDTGCISKGKISKKRMGKFASIVLDDGREVFGSGEAIASLRRLIEVKEEEKIGKKKTKEEKKYIELLGEVLEQREAKEEPLDMPESIAEAHIEMTEPELITPPSPIVRKEPIPVKEDIRRRIYKCLGL